MAAGVPVAADAVGQNREYIQDGRSGLLIPPGNDEAFVEVVIRLLQDPSLRATLAAGARERMRNQFGWEKLAERVERAYRP